MSEKQIVHTTSLFSVDDEFTDERFMRVRIAVMHSGKNRNNSRFSKECIEKAKDSFANIPILAHVVEYEDENGNKFLDYSGHDMHVEENKFKKGEGKMIYDEVPVGVIPESSNFELVLDEETGNYYAYVDGIIYREYGNYAADILESRGGKTDVSAEIACDDCSYHAEDKCLDVGVMQMCGIALLAESVAPGMQGANAQVFSSNESDREEKFMKIMQELTEALNNYKIRRKTHCFSCGI